MHFSAIANTDIGITKETNQDSLCLLHARSNVGEIIMAIICDGMGGLSKGELASATVIRAFDEWFHSELPKELVSLDMEVIASKWDLILKSLNGKIMEYGREQNVSLGTTFTGVLMVEDKYLIVHVGDSRAYFIGSDLKQITQDHTFVAREIEAGRMTPEQAAVDERRNVLLQCIGASKTITSQQLVGKVMPGTYLLCSDGFRHKITKQEMIGAFHKDQLANTDVMSSRASTVIDGVKRRGEKDNISVIVIKVE